MMETAPKTRRSRLSNRTLLAVTAAVGVAVWVVSPRFSIDGPSLVDDWSAIERSPAQVRHLVRLFTSADVGPSGQRYRPGWVLWNQVQWHTLGAPSGLAGPNFWDVARLLLLVGGVSSVVAVVLHLRIGLTSRMSWAAIALAPLLVVSTPQFAVDLARFGPQEPLLIGAMTLGGSLLSLGIAGLLDHTQRFARIGLLLAVGYAFWLVGVYQKESSVCVAALTPFAVAAARQELMRVGALDRARRWLLAAIAIAVAAPVAHVTVEVVLIARRGELVYGMTAQPSGGTASKVADSLIQMPSSLGSLAGWALLVCLIAIVVRSIARRESDWMQIGLLVVALAFLGWSAQSGVFPSRYYMPTVALASIGLCVFLVQLSGRARVGAFALATGLTVVSLAAAHSKVADWARGESRGVAFVHAVMRARATGCPVAAAGLDPERSVALPVLSKPADLASTCGGAAYLVTGAHRRIDALIRACLPTRRRLVGQWDLGPEPVRLDRCTSLDTRQFDVFTRHAM